MIMKSILYSYLFFGLFCFATPSFGQSNACQSEFAQMVKVVNADYSGYKDKIRGKEKERAALEDRLRTEASQTKDFAVCPKILRQYVAWFRDGHLSVSLVEANSEDKTEQPLQDFTSQNDLFKPKLEFLDENTALLKISSFEINYKPILDALLKQNQEKLAVTQTLIIDLRNNGGGGDSTYENLLPLLYTNPIKTIGADIWASAANIKFYDDLMQNQTLPEKIKVQLRLIVSKMKIKPNTLVSMGDDGMLKLNKTLVFPKQVAILINKNCASTTEQFLLAAKQSRKVKIFGDSNSAGVLDYANVRDVILPSGKMILNVPASRSRRLPNNPVDPDGIAPDVKITSKVVDQISFIQGYLSR